MRTQHSVWSNFLESTFYRPVLFHNLVIAEDMRRPYSVWCIFLEFFFYRSAFFSNSVTAEDMRRSYSVWCNFSQKYLIQNCSFSNSVLTEDVWLFRNAITLENSVIGRQCGAITLEKSLTHLLFLLLQFLQKTCERHTQCDAIFR